jgi:hypothetical protein
MRLITSKPAEGKKSSGTPVTAKKPLLPTKRTTPAATDEESNDKAVRAKAERTPSERAFAITEQIKDATRPTSLTELVMDLQRRVIDLEAKENRRLTAAEWAIAVKLFTGTSLDEWERRGYVSDKCPCDNPKCKGWTLIPIDTARQGGGVSKPMGKDRPVTRGEIEEDQEARLDKKSPAKKVMAKIDYDTVLQDMFDEKLLKMKGDVTYIPPDGPASVWSTEQKLAVAKGFGLKDLMDLGDKPRELTRQLIESLRKMGYTVNANLTPEESAPRKSISLDELGLPKKSVVFGEHDHGPDTPKHLEPDEWRRNKKFIALHKEAENFRVALVNDGLWECTGFNCHDCVERDATLDMPVACLVEAVKRAKKQDKAVSYKFPIRLESHLDGMTLQDIPVKYRGTD